MSQNSVLCIAFSRLQADQMVQRLKWAAFSIHDISVLSAAGPLVAALGDMSRGLLGQGVPLSKARLYEDRLKEGQTLVSVQTGNDDEVMLAKEIFVKAGGSAVCATEKFFQQQRAANTPRQTQPSESRLSFA